MRTLTGETTIRAADAIGLAIAVLTRVGYRSGVARHVAQHLTDTSLFGVDSHGLRLLPVFAAEVLDGRVNPNASPGVLIGRQATTVIAGNRASGIETARLALAASLEAARALGVGAAVATEAGYVGALAPLVNRASRVGLIGILCVNSEACVAPYGGSEPLHGTNPIAVGAPRLGRPDFLLDMRTNALRMDELSAALAGGATLPPGRVLDEHGQPSQNPADAARGTLLPADGYRGYGLALVVDMLASGLAGGAVGQEVTSRGPATFSIFALVLNPRLFQGIDAFVRTLSRLSTQIDGIRPMLSDAPARMPGERAAAERRRRLTAGIPVDLEHLRSELERLGLAGIVS